jgi:hypothetical protein
MPTQDAEFRVQIAKLPTSGTLQSMRAERLTQAKNWIVLGTFWTWRNNVESNCCPVCHTEGIPFGTLGIRKHLRCRHCGIDFSYVSNDEPQAETASEDEILETERF